MDHGSFLCAEAAQAAPPDSFGIRELMSCGGSVWLTLLGELDLAAAPTLEQRLDQLRTARTPVRVDLSRLEFIDSAGLTVLIAAWKAAQDDGWRLEIDPHLSNQARKLFELVAVDRMLATEETPRP